MFGQPLPLLSIVLSASLLPDIVYSQPGPDHPPRENVVWRADTVTPEELVCAGGFWPRGIPGGNSLMNRRSSPLVSPDISLFNHVLDPNNPADVTEGLYVPNPHYDPMFEGSRWGGAQFQLAGFPPGHEALWRYPWNVFTDCAPNHHRRTASLECSTQMSSAKDTASRYMSSIKKIDQLILHAWLADDRYAGTTDSITIQIGRFDPIAVFRIPGAGASARITINVTDTLKESEITLGDISSLAIIHEPLEHSLSRDDFIIGGLLPRFARAVACNEPLLTPT